MGEGIARVRGGKRKKLEELIVEAGYFREYVDVYSPFTHHDKKRVFIAKLARAMNQDLNAFNTKFSNKKGISLPFAQDILEFLKTNHLELNITLKI